jgi:two-component system chemotaxis sensor kinase CheA
VTQPPSLPKETLEAIRAVFFEECEEHLGDLESGLLAIQENRYDDEVVNTIFRAAHSIKGGAGIFELTAVIRLAHVFESVLSEVRGKTIALEPGLVKTMLKAADALSDLIHAARDGLPADEAAGEAASAALSAALPAPPPDPLEEWAFEPRPVAFETFEFDTPIGEDFDISFRPYAELYAKANEPLVLLRELRRLGRLDAVLDDAAVPLLDDLQPEESYLSWRLRLHTVSDEAALREVFEFVEDDCELEIVPADPASLFQPLPVFEAAAEPAVGPAGVEAEAPATAAASPAPAAVVQPQPSIRVDLSRVDRMVSLVSELVIGQAMLAQQLSHEQLSRRSSVSAILEDLDQLTRQIQDSVMAIRAQQVKSVFQRMSRLVREVEAATGKPVRLVTEGETTEVDRTIIERLTDPLTHMVRNAIDHGLESPEARRAAGKPAEGLVRISAAHRAGRVVIEVADDGGGIDRERVRNVAVERGVISADAVLSDEELDNLIFAPGFSTAPAVSDLSGRGVGMDVVRRSVQDLGGRLTVASRRGEGSVFTLSLPLTLAVLDGMLVSVAGQTVVTPLTALLESFVVRPADVQRLGPDDAVITLRGAHVPLIDLAPALGYARTDPAAERSVALLVEDADGQRAALLVDDIQEQRQVVIKSLETNYQQVRGVAAATILGDGRVALILDIEAILTAQRRRQDGRCAQAA